MELLLWCLFYEEISSVLNEVVELLTRFWALSYYKWKLIANTCRNVKIVTNYMRALVNFCISKNCNINFLNIVHKKLICESLVSEANMTDEEHAWVRSGEHVRDIDEKVTDVSDWVGEFRDDW